MKDANGQWKCRFCGIRFGVRDKDRIALNNHVDRCHPDRIVAYYFEDGSLLGWYIKHAQN